MKKLKLIIEVVKFIGIIAHLLEAFDYIESFIKRRTQKKVNPVGFKTEEWSWLNSRRSKQVWLSFLRSYYVRLKMERNLETFWRRRSQKQKQSKKQFKNK